MKKPKCKTKMAKHKLARKQLKSRMRLGRSIDDSLLVAAGLVVVSHGGRPRMVHRSVLHRSALLMPDGKPFTRRGQMET